MRAIFTLTAVLATTVLTASLAADGPPPAGKPKTPPAPEAFYEHTGFEGREQILTDAIVRAIREAKPAGGAVLEFTPDQQRLLGLAVATAIKTISDDKPYQHEMNDALIKAHLTNIQFAKDHGLLKEMIEHEVKTQTPMIVRTGKMIRDGGSPELATIALTERTACFYQLVQNYQRTGTTMRWKSPYGNVLGVTRQLGQHDLTEQEIHEIYTVPLMRRQAEVMGMQLDISPWQADGWITMTVRAPVAGS